MTWGSWLDEYDREARLLPALLTILPLALAAIGLGFQDNAVLVAVIALLLTVGLPMVAAKQVADRGRVIEAALFEKWGAPPTTLMLVPPVHGTVSEVLAQRRARLQAASGINLPTDPSLTPSDMETYQAAVRWLIENTRDHAKFPVVWAELKNYGFDRNTLGLQRLALATSTLGVIALGIGAVAGALGAKAPIWPSVILAGMCSVVGLWWWKVPSANRVRTAADRYAERLLDASAALT